jgi:hypothetical protein
MGGEHEPMHRDELEQLKVAVGETKRPRAT